jgi:hypothetical protein
LKEISIKGGRIKCAESFVDMQVQLQITKSAFEKILRIL